MKHFAKFIYEESAATAVEYAVMLAGILMVCIGAVAALGGTTSDRWNLIHSDMEDHGIR
jgi:Flp pilus assembly pilin Flp